MKLYTFDPAPNPRRLQLFLDYKGIDVDTEQVDLMKQAQHEEPFISLNPLRTVPTLQLEDGTVLTEVIAQAQYLESLYPDKPLMGTTDMEKAQVLQWDHLVLIHGLASIGQMFRNQVKGFREHGVPGPVKVAQIPELVERGKLLLDAFWEMTEARLGEVPWLAGENFSFADIDLVCTVEFAGWVKESVPADCKAVLDWHGRALAALPQPAA